MVKFFRTFGQGLNGVLLLLIGSVGIQILASDRAWYFLHPKYQWLMGVSASCLMLLGVVLATQPRAPARVTTTFCFAILLVLSLGANPQRLLEGSLVNGAIYEYRGEPTMIFEDQVYTKMNLAELALFADQPESVTQSLRVVVRGKYLGIDTTGQAQFLIYRPMVWCCFSDALAFGFVVDCHEMIDGAENSWVQVVGELVELTNDISLTTRKSPEGFWINVNREKMLTAKKVQRIPPPSVPIIFTARSEPPYNW